MRIGIQGISFAVVVLLPLSLAAPVHAQAKVCKDDRARLCEGASKKECKLGKFLDQLSPACRAVVEEKRASRGGDEMKKASACDDDRERLCAGKSRSECKLGKFKEQLTKACRKALKSKKAAAS